MAKYNSENLNQNGLTTKRKWGISLFVISLFLFIFSVFNIIVPLRNFILGVFGFAIYPILIGIMIAGIFMMSKKEYYVKKLYLFVCIGLFLIIVSFFQLVLTDIDTTFANYISNCYNGHNTVGGVIVGCLTYLIWIGLGTVGTILMQIVAIVLCVALIIDNVLKQKEYKDISDRTITYPEMIEKDKKIEKISKSKQKQQKFEQLETIKREKETEKIVDQKKSNITLDGYVESKNAKKLLLEKTSYKDEDDMAVRIFGEDFVNSIKATSSTKAHTPEKKEYNISDLYKKQEPTEVFSFNEKTDNKPSRFIHVDEEPLVSARLDIKEQQKTQPIEEKKIENVAPVVINKPVENKIIEEKEEQRPEIEQVVEQDIDDDILLDDDDDFEDENPFYNTKAQDQSESFEEEDIEESEEEREAEEIEEIKPQKKFDIEETIKEDHEPEKPKEKKVYEPYIKPPLDLLTTKSSQIGNDNQDYQRKGLILEQTLESFKISAKVVGITKGPAVTRYELQMPIGIPVKRITQHTDDITMMMESRASVRIETPIPGRNLVGVEIPNDSIATIGLKDILEDEKFYNSKGKLTFALGKNITGECMVCDLDSMPHLLVAGSTGSGKSVCLNVLLISLLYKLGPDDLKLLLIDPKRVEFVSYNYLPHMLVPRAINDAQQAINALDWAIEEMMRRYQMFSERNVRNFKEYNSSDDVLNKLEEKLPYIVIVIDELSDLMMLAGRDLEEKIQRLTQLARAAGIHLIIATQRPSVNVITGVIKANMPSRIAFAVTDFASSKTILDKGGADKLLGKGDMLYAPQNLPEPVRVQCPYVDSKEVVNIVEFIKNHNKAEFDDTISAFITKNDKQQTQQSVENSQGSEFDPILPQALLDFIQSGSCSASMIQRRHSIGFVRAGRIVDQMEKAGFISAPDPVKRTRTVLITLEKYNEIFGEDEE